MRTLRKAVRYLTLLCAVLAFLALTPGVSLADRGTNPHAETIARLSFSYQGTAYPYLVYTPKSYRAESKYPVLLLIHGAHGEGSYMLELWRAFADSHGILLVAPTFPLTVEFEDLVPRLLPALIDTVAQSWSIDQRRRYIFGYSAGGYSTYSAAIYASTYFAAVGVFATIITPDYEGIVTAAERKTPTAIYIGDHDQYWTTAQTRRTRDLLIKNGFPVEYKELRQQDHNYATAAKEINADAWRFMSQYTSP